MNISGMFRSILVCTLCAWAAGPLAATEWRLTFAVTEDNVIESPKGDAPARHESRQYTQSVALGQDYLVVQDDRQKTVYDFARRRLVVLDLAQATYQDRSLYHLPSFFEYELMNRNAI
ncbi:MAG: hypothetical protein HYV75_11835, partial [Opitutae bacterium]|nr:hypothetical protein [Opitutae bacterium]